MELRSSCGQGSSSIGSSRNVLYHHSGSIVTKGQERCTTADQPGNSPSTVEVKLCWRTLVVLHCKGGACDAQQA